MQQLVGPLRIRPLVFRDCAACVEGTVEQQGGTFGSGGSTAGNANEGGRFRR